MQGISSAGGRGPTCTACTATSGGRAAISTGRGSERLVTAQTRRPAAVFPPLTPPWGAGGSEAVSTTTPSQYTRAFRRGVYKVKGVQGCREHTGMDWCTSYSMSSQIHGAGGTGACV